MPALKTRFGKIADFILQKPLLFQLRYCFKVHIGNIIFIREIKFITQFKEWGSLFDLQHIRGNVRHIHTPDKIKGLTQTVRRLPRCAEHKIQADIENPCRARILHRFGYLFLPCRSAQRKPFRFYSALHTD